MVSLVFSRERARTHTHTRKHTHTPPTIIIWQIQNVFKYSTNQDTGDTQMCFCWHEEMSQAVFVSEMKVYLSEILWLQRCSKISRACGFCCLPACVHVRACVRAWLPVAPLCWVLHDTATYFDYDNRDFISRMLGFSNKAFLRYTVAWKLMIIVTWCICVFKVLISSILVLSNTYEYEHNESVYQVSCSSGQNILRNSNSFHYCKGHCNWS